MVNGKSIAIPRSELESTKCRLRELIDERTSASWADYDDEDISQRDQDLEDIEKLETVLDVLRFIRDQGGQNCLVEWISCLDPKDGFSVEGKEWPDEEDEDAFRSYLVNTYGIMNEEFPEMPG